MLFIKSLLSIISQKITKAMGSDSPGDFFGHRWPKLGIVGKGVSYRLRIFSSYECQSPGFRTIVEQPIWCLEPFSGHCGTLGPPPVEIFGSIHIYGLRRIRLCQSWPMNCFGLRMDLKISPKNMDFWLWRLAKPISPKSHKMMWVWREPLDIQLSKTVKISFIQPVGR